MTEEELAGALVQSGRLTVQQVQDAALHRSLGRGIAHVLVELGLVSTDEILQIDPHAFEQVPQVQAPPISAPMASPYSSPGQPVGPPQIRFDAIGEAWRLCQQQMGMWVAAILIMAVIVGVFSSVVNNVLEAIPAFAPSKPPPGNPWAIITPLFFMQVSISSLIQAPVLAFMAGGLFRMAINQLRTGIANVGDIFTVTDVFPALLGAYFVASVLSFSGMLLFIIPGFILKGMLMFAVPIVVNQRLGAGDALSLSWNTLKPHVIPAAFFIFVAGLASFLGFFLCCIGILFTAPIFYLSIAIVYRDFFPDQVRYEAPPVTPSTYGSPPMSPPPAPPPTGS